MGAWGSRPRARFAGFVLRASLRASLGGERDGVDVVQAGVAVAVDGLPPEAGRPVLVEQVGGAAADVEARVGIDTGGLYHLADDGSPVGAMLREGLAGPVPRHQDAAAAEAGVLPVVGGSGTCRVVFDLDGPSCAVCSGRGAADLATTLLSILDPAPVADDATNRSRDPLDVLRWTADNRPDALAAVENLLDQGEQHSIASAEPTPGSHDLIRRLCGEGKIVAVASNNGYSAITSCLATHGLA